MIKLSKKRTSEGTISTELDYNNGDLVSPYSIEIDSNNTMYILDTDSDLRTIKTYDLSTKTLASIPEFGDSLVYPYGIAIDSNDNLWIADYDGNTVYKFDTTTKTLSTVINSDNITYPNDIAFDSKGNLWIADDNQNLSMSELATTLTGTPTVDDLGDYNISLSVTNGTNTVDQNFTVKVTYENHAPISQNFTVTTDEDTNATFSLNDFNFSDPESSFGDSVESIFITTLPSKGILTLNDENITQDQNISVDDIANLKYIPGANGNGDAYATFGFKVSDGDLNSSEYTATFNVTPVNDAPTVTSTTITTAKEDNLYSYILGAEDIEGTDLNWSVVNKPDWLSLGSTPSSWASLGEAGFSAGSAAYISIAINSSGTPYVVYQDVSNGNKANVMKYNGSSWELVGESGFSAGNASYTSIAFDSNDTPYVVYKDAVNSYKATVMKYNGSSWQPVGTAGFSADTADYTTIAF